MIRIFTLGFFLLTSCAKSFADVPKQVFYPPNNITLNYDLKNSVLHVAADHPSQNWSIDYVNTMSVSLNGNEKVNQTYTRQNAAGFADDVPLKAQAGDVVAVVLSTSRGMSASAQITIEETDDDEK